MPTSEQLFQTIPCPLCGSNDFEVRRKSQYPASINREQLKQIFRASSDHILMDQVVQCRSCDLVYVNPRLHPDVILEGYAEAEDPVFAAQNESRVVAFRKTLGKIVKRLGAPAPGSRLLDVGCAGGAFLVAAREAGYDVVGVEPSHWMAAFGRRTYGLDIRDKILTEGMFPEHSFDVITLWDVIEHLPDPRATLELIRSLLKPGGYLFVNYPDIGSFAARLLGKRWPFWLSVHLLYYTPKTIAAQLEKAGFTMLWRQPFWPVLPLGYVARRAAPYSPALAPVPKLVGLLKLDEMPLTYNIGQTLVVSRVR